MLFCANYLTPFFQSFVNKKSVYSDDKKEENAMDITKFINSLESLCLPLTNETNLKQYGVLQVSRGEYRL